MSEYNVGYVDAISDTSCDNDNIVEEYSDGKEYYDYGSVGRSGGDLAWKDGAWRQAGSGKWPLPLRADARAYCFSSFGVFEVVTGYFR